MALMDEAVWRGKIYSGGWVAGSGGDAPVIESATGAELGRTGLAAPADVAGAVRLAAAAQPAWAATPHTERSAILRRAADLWLAQAQDIEWWGIRESGKIPPAMAFETHVATTEIYQAATLPSRASGELLPSETPRLSFAERVPVGVAGVIAPFNFPQILAIRSVAPALALGSAVVLKPDPRTAVCGGVALARVFAEAGLPDGLLQVLPGGPPAGEMAARHLKRVHLELGGNSALIVLDDPPAGTWRTRPSTTTTWPRWPTRQIPAGIVHINEQTVDDEPNIPFGGLGASGTGARFGGTANLDAFTDTRWVTIRGDIAPYPF